MNFILLIPALIDSNKVKSTFYFIQNNTNSDNTRRGGWDF